MADPAPDASGLLNLKQVARALGVHYMTAYRYVRQGRLHAERHGNVWLVDPAELDGFRTTAKTARPTGPPGTAPGGRDRGAGSPGPAAPRAGGAPADPAGTDTAGTADTADTGGADWPGRFRDRLLAGDEVGAWTVVGHALASGHSPQRVYLDLISESMAGIGTDVADGGLASADQYVATATALRVVARLGARFRRRGRSKGTLVLGAPSGERHALPIAVVADLVRLAGFTVIELGADVPPEAFGLAARRADRLVAVGIGVTTVDHLDAARAAVAAVRLAVPGVPVLVGGQAVRSAEIARLLGVDEWAAGGEDVVAAVERLASRRRAARRRRAPGVASTTTAPRATAPPGHHGQAGDRLGPVAR